MRLGSKKISREIKQQLLRDTPRKMRPRRTQEPTVAMTHKTLIESFTQKDFVMYEQLLHQYGTSGRKKEKMLWYLNRRGITDGPCRELAEIRNSDLKLHHKIVQQLRNMWYDLADHKKEKVKSDCELFWSSMATRILRTPKDRSHIHLSSKWSGSEKKAGTCAIFGQLMG